MKKFLLALVALVCVSAVSAQEYKHAAGLRLGYGVELQYEHNFSSQNFLKANLGLFGYHANFMASATYNWNLFQWNWTPSVGKWFFTAGVGGSLGVWGGGFQLGVSGDAAFGLRFKNVPITLALDYRPTIYFFHHAWGHGFAGASLSATYNF